MAELRRPPKPHNKSTKSASRPLYKGIPKKSIDSKDTRNEPVTAVLTGIDSAVSQTEQANRLFLSEVGSIRGVAAANLRGGKDSTEQFIVVFVPTLLCDVSEQVTQLRTRLHEMYPEARLEVRIKGLKERGFDPDKITAVDMAQL